VHICRAKGRSSRDADRDLWRRIVDLLEHVRNMPAQLDRLELEFGIKGAAGHADIEHDGDGHVGLGHGGGGHGAGGHGGDDHGHGGDGATGGHGGSRTLNLIGNSEV
jgi:hypothetical protein